MRPRRTGATAASLVAVLATLTGSPVSAQSPSPPQLVITGVVISPTQLTITGRNLVKSGLPGVSIAGMALAVNSASPTHVVATLGTPLQPGGYRLVVERGPASTDYGSFDLTVAAASGDAVDHSVFARLAAENRFTAANHFEGPGSFNKGLSAFNPGADQGGVANGAAVTAHSVKGIGVSAGTDAQNLPAVLGWAFDQGTGVNGNSAHGVGIRGSLSSCDDDPCVPTAGTAGEFLAGAGGALLRGYLVNSFDPNYVGVPWEERFRVDADGTLTIDANAFKPGGGSWSTLSDRRTKQGIQPIAGALRQLLDLRGVTFEYTNPSAFGESAGTHIGMVAQDVEGVFPSWVDVGRDGYRRLTFRGFEAVAVEAIRELEASASARDDSADARIGALERENAALRDALDALTRRLAALERK